MMIGVIRLKARTLQKKNRMNIKTSCKACSCGALHAKIDLPFSGFKEECNSDYMLKFFELHPCPCLSCIIKITCTDTCEEYRLHRIKYGDEMNMLCYDYRLKNDPNYKKIIEAEQKKYVL